MRTIKFTLLLLGLFAFLFTSCVKDDDFDLPNINTKPVTFNGKVVALDDVVKTSSDKVQAYIENNAIEGYVISSDQGGNYYKKIYIQTLDGKNGFSVAINKAGLYAEYPVGAKVQVRLKDLTVQLINGKLEVGFSEHANKYGDIFVGQIPDGVYREKLVNTGETVDIEKIAHVVTSLKELDKDEYINRLIIVKDVAFDLAVVGKPYHQKENDKRFGSDYTIFGKKGGQLTFRTSKYAKYATKTVPKEIVNITGVLTKYKKYYQFMVNRYEDIQIQEGTSGADVINAGGGDDNPDYSPKVVTTLNEKFDNIKVGKKGEKVIPINIEGWANVKVKGDREWIGKMYSGNRYAQISGYKSKASEIEAWLVTPGLDLAKAEDKIFSFDSKRQHSGDETLEVLISSDFKGDVTKASWKKLDGYKLAKKDKDYGTTENSGKIDLSSYNGVVYVAFKYVGNGTDKAGTFHIDNVKFNSKGDNNEDEVKAVKELNETFDTVTVKKKIKLEGWTNVREEGGRDWIGKEYNNNRYAQISGYKSKDNSIISWFVTPGLDLKVAANKNFSFDSKRLFSGDETLEVLISSDFKGDVKKATWKKLEGYVLGDANPKYGKTKNSGNIDLSSYSGVVNVAFKYSGNGTDKAGTFQIDNVKFNYTADDNGGNKDKTLKINVETVSLKVGEIATVEITSGNGAYIVTSSEETIATATEKDGKITITAKAEGTADITVEDTKTKETKKIAVTVKKEEENPPATDSKLLFPGADFEDWATFEKSLKYPLKGNLVKQSADGKDGGNALAVKGKTDKKNGYLFTVKVPENFSTKDKTKIVFYLKGTTEKKSLSINLHQNDKEYYKFNLKDCGADKTLQKAADDRNNYNGKIDTNGKWVKITLDISAITNIATKAGDKLISFKYGKKSEYDVLIDNISIE